jgi:hypothetical protein
MASHNSFTQGDWEDRALTKNLRLLGPVIANHLRVKAKCLTCDSESYLIPQNIHRGLGCPNCRKLEARKIQSQRWFKFAEELKFTWQGEPPTGVRDKGARAICDLCGGVWRVVPSSLYAKKELGHPRCPVVPNKNVGAIRGAYQGGETLLQGDPSLAAQWHPSKNSESSPGNVSKGSKLKAWWIGPCNHEWQATVASRSAGRGCPLCANQIVAPGLNSLATTHPELLRSWDFSRNTISPDAISWGSSKAKVWWLCELGHPWEATPVKRASGQGCPICSNQKILVGFNDIASTHPELLSSWDFERNVEIAPTDLTSGSTRVKVWWKCEVGHPWRTSVPKRIEGQGCPTCAKSGFDPNSPGYLYFVWHQNWEMYQIGITNYPKKRLASHRANGFELLEIRGPMEGHMTARWETALLRFLKRNGADLGNQMIAGKFDGFTESWTAGSYRAESLKALMDLCDATEGN